MLILQTGVSGLEFGLLVITVLFLLSMREGRSQGAHLWLHLLT